MKTRFQITALCTILLFFFSANEFNAQNKCQDTTLLKEISNQLTSKYWMLIAKESSKQDLICELLLEFKLDGQAFWHPIFQKILLNDLSKLDCFVKNESFRNNKYTFSDQYILYMSSQKSGSDMYNICLKRHNATYTIEQLSDSVLILKNNEFSRMIFISADMLNNQDFVIANSNLIPKDTIGKNRIRGIWAVNSEGKSEKPIAKNDAIRKELWLQRLKDKGRWVYNPDTDRDNLPVSPTMYPNYQNQPRF